MASRRNIYLASTFIVFWERDITSENHGTLVHLHITVYILSLLFSCYHYHYLLRLSFVNRKAGGIDNSSVLVGSKVICICVQVQVKLATSAPLFTLPPSWILQSPMGDKPWYLCQGKTCRCTISHPVLGLINEG